MFLTLDVILATLGARDFSCAVPVLVGRHSAKAPRRTQEKTSGTQGRSSQVAEAT